MVCTQNLITRFFGMKGYGPDPFGSSLVVVGEKAEGNPFRFSTKYADDETGLLYYGYRYYSATLGRWGNRDPTDRIGNQAIQCFAANNPVNALDLLGREAISSGTAVGGLTWTCSGPTQRMCRNPCKACVNKQANGTGSALTKPEATAAAMADAEPKLEPCDEGCADVGRWFSGHCVFRRNP